MSGTLNRFVAEVVPDAAEAYGRYEQNQDGTPKPRKPRMPRVPGSTNPNPNPSAGLGKQESRMNLKTDEIQASLDGVLAKMVNEQPTAEGKANLLIKIGMIKTDLAGYAPMLKSLDPALGEDVLNEWFAGGDEALKKAVYNATVGADEAQMSLPEESAPMQTLAKMVDAVPEGRRTAMAATIGFYTTDLRKMLEVADQHGASVEQREAMIKQWVEQGDGSHQEMKKAVADAEAEENPLHEIVGNASTYAGTALHSTRSPGYDKPIAPKFPSGEGAGRRMSGAFGFPGQDNEENDETDIDSGTETSNGATNVRPGMKIRRKGTTGGLGSVQGMPQNSRGGGVKPVQNDDDAFDNDSYEKADDLAQGLVKFIPSEMVDQLLKFDNDTQVAVMGLAAHHAADLMAWSDQVGDTLAKSTLDASVQEWLVSDPRPEAIQLKKWTAEALASAEEIPLELGRAIMAWSPARPQLRKRAA